MGLVTEDGGDNVCVAKTATLVAQTCVGAVIALTGLHYTG